MTQAKYDKGPSNSLPRNDEREEESLWEDLGKL